MENNSKNTVIKFGGGILNVLLVIFVVAKIVGLGDIANWSWWIVLSPLWGPFAIIGLILALIGIGVGFVSLFLWLYSIFAKTKN